MRRSKLLNLIQNSWQQAKYAKLYSGLLWKEKWILLIALWSQHPLYPSPGATWIHVIFLRTQTLPGLICCVQTLTLALPISKHKKFRRTLFIKDKTLILVLPVPDSAGQNCPDFSVVLVFFNSRRCWWKPGMQVLLLELVCPLCGSSRRCPRSVCWETTDTRTVAGHSVSVWTESKKIK